MAEPEEIGYCVIDTETTGLFLKDENGTYLPADDPTSPHLAWFCALYTNPDLSLRSVFDIPILPDGWEVLPEASAINGLTTQKLREIGEPVDAALDAYTGAIEAGMVIVSYGTWFDLKVMRGALRRAGRDDLYAKTRHICAMRAFGGRWPKLRDTCANLGIDFPMQHTARGDADACLEIARKLKATGRWPSPRGGS